MVEKTYFQMKKKIPKLQQNIYYLAAVRPLHLVLGLLYLEV